MYVHSVMRLSLICNIVKWSTMINNCMYNVGIVCNVSCGCFATLLKRNLSWWCKWNLKLQWIAVLVYWGFEQMHFLRFNCSSSANMTHYTLSQLKNDCDVSAYSGGRCLLSHAQLMFSHAFKQEDCDWRIKGASLQRVSMGALSDITVVLGMRQV